MPTIALGDLKALVYSRLEQNSAFYTAEEVTEAINDAVQVLNLFTGFIQKTVTITSKPAPDGVYPVPASILVPTRVAFRGRYLSPAPFKDFGHAYSAWPKETTETAGIPVSHWLPIGLTRFAIFPMDIAGGNPITITGVAEPDPLEMDVSEIAYPTEFGDILEEYAVHLLLVKNAGVVAKAAMLQYQGFLRRMKSLRRYRASINPQFFVEAGQ